MKPSYIYLIRHGESEGNINKELYKTLPDWKVPLTKKGIKQARVVGERVLRDIHKEFEEWYGKRIVTVNPTVPDACIYCSPWYRARQTAEKIRKFIRPSFFREDPRLREQEWGNYKEDELTRKINRERYKFGTFFYRMPFGESGADVYDRISGFLDTLHRDFEKPEFPRRCIIISHGLTIRVLLMRWFHWTVEEYENLKNPGNCAIIKLELQENCRYKLISKLRKRS